MALEIYFCIPVSPLVPSAVLRVGPLPGVDECYSIEGFLFQMRLLTVFKKTSISPTQ